MFCMLVAGVPELTCQDDITSTKEPEHPSLSSLLQSRPTCSGSLKLTQVCIGGEEDSACIKAHVMVDLVVVFTGIHHL